MAIIISRYNKGKPISEEEMEKISLTNNLEVNKTLNQVLMRINRESKHQERSANIKNRAD